MDLNPPFELEDQTDLDFFDKLVNDEDDVGSGLKGSELMRAHETLDGDVSDELKTFANLNISETGNGSDGLGEKGVTSGDDDVKERNVEAKERGVGDGEAINPPVSSDSFSFDNGYVSEDGAANADVELVLRKESFGSEAGGAKELQWSSFSDTAEHGSGGFGSYSDFFTDLGGAVGPSQNEATKTTTMENSYSHTENQGENGVVLEQRANEADMNNTQYWENLYPGWKYDSNTGQWYQLDACDGTANRQENVGANVGNVQGSFEANGESHWAVSGVQSSQLSYAQQTAQSAIETVSDFNTPESVSGWNDISQQNGEYNYPAHMFFDPQYPGWYYDTIAQEWCSLDMYHFSAQSTDQAHNLQTKNGFLSAAAYSSDNSQSINDGGLQGLSEGQKQNWATSVGNYSQQGTHAWQSEVLMDGRSTVSPGGALSWQSSYDSNIYSNSHVSELKFPDSVGTVKPYDKTSQSYDNPDWVGGLQSSVPDYHAFQQFNHSPQGKQNGPVEYSAGHYSSHNTAGVSQPVFPNGHHVSYAPSEGRSSAGRPPHAFCTFAFGGKLIVMKDNSASGFAMLGSKDAEGRLISVLNLMEVAGVNNGPSGVGAGTCSYFHSLSHQSFPGPLVGGNVWNKELRKWIDERIANCDSVDMNYGNGKALKLLLSLLKIACQHYGKLRSFGADTGLMENDLPESAVAELFASAKMSSDQFGECHAVTKCLMTYPSEAHIQTTASEVQNLLISGRKKEALQRAQEGQFWGFALILARELGDQFYADTVKQMAVSELVVGSPLRTLCLLIAKKPEEVFSPNIKDTGYLPGAVHMSPQPVQNVGYSMLDNWEQNLAVITANRTENDHLVIIHLGDCLWKEKIDVTAAHICYLVAEADFELYSDSARLCLIGADHLNFPRTYASPEAIQRTELFEYSKMLGNSQFVLLPLQPYKVIYAHMLAEVGRVSDSLKYCQAVYKALKTARSPEAETLKQLLSSLEERIRTHQQSGYAANLAPAKIVGKLLNFFDSTAHRVVGGLPPPVPSITQGSGQSIEHHFQSSGPKVSSSQSTMAMSSLTPSASMEPVSQWAVDGSRMTLQNRSISEPNIGRTPSQDSADSSNEPTSSSSDGKQSGSTGTSRFGRLSFGAQIFQKTVGLVMKPRQGRQAKLGETNRFYYDEKLKRWVEEGAEPPAEESALPPPPTAAFQNGTPGYNLKNSLHDGLHVTNGSPESMSSMPVGSSLGSPAIPPSSNQFSARGRMSVRSRYVDTFNKGGSSTAMNMFQTPSVPSAKPTSVASAKFFIPTPTPSNEQTFGAAAGDDGSSESAESSSNPMNDPFQNLAPLPAGTMQRFPSVDNIPEKGIPGSRNSSFASQSRRTSSWSGIPSGTLTPPTMTAVKASREASAISPLPFMPNAMSSADVDVKGGGTLGDDLQEVEL